MSETLADRFTGLRQRFRDRAKTQLEALERIAREVEVGAAASSFREETLGIAHSLAGASGSFGFARLSACAAEFEEFVSNGPTSRELAEAYDALIAELRRMP